MKNVIILLSVLTLGTFFKINIKVKFIDFTKLRVGSEELVNNCNIGSTKFNEVRIIRSKHVIKVWTDVLTKYQKDQTECPDDILTEISVINSRYIKIINKYSS